MQYECECGCGEKIEKTIAFSTACRMRIRRNPVMKRNKNVTNDNKSVTNGNTVVTKRNKESNAGVTETCGREGCTNPKHKDWYWCKEHIS